MVLLIAEANCLQMLLSGGTIEDDLDDGQEHLKSKSWEASVLTLLGRNDCESSTYISSFIGFIW